MEFTLGSKHQNQPKSLGTKSSHVNKSLGIKQSYSLPKNSVASSQGNNGYSVQENSYGNDTFHEPLGLKQTKNIKKSKLEK